MEWLYKQSTGELFLKGSPVITPFAVGYSGCGSGKNNPDMQCVKDIGPIPKGWYTLGEILDEPAAYTIKLIPDVSNEMCSRSGFLIHADSIQRPGWASQGCIIIPDATKRESIANGGVKRLEVIV